MISFIDRFRISNLAQHEDRANIGLIERPRRFDPMFVVNITYIFCTRIVQWKLSLVIVCTTDFNTNFGQRRDFPGQTH